MDRRREMWLFTTMLENAGVPYVKTYTPSNETHIVGINEGDNTLLFKFDSDGALYVIK